MQNSNKLWWPGLPLAIALGVTLTVVTKPFLGADVGRYIGSFGTMATMGWFIAASAPGRTYSRSARAIAAVFAGLGGIAVLLLLEVVLPV